MELLKRFFFHFKISLDIHMSGGRTLMPKPKGNDCDINTGLKEMHGRGMTEGMGRYLSFLKGWKLLCGLFYSQTKSILNT